MNIHKQIGWLTHNGVGFEVIGICCEDKLRPNGVVDSRHYPKIYEVNVSPYKQTCACCKRTLVAGLTEKWTELYDGKSH